MGTTCEYPPPAAPPFMPNTGPSEGSLNARTHFLPMRFKAMERPVDTVVFPSPAGVGFMAVTRMSLPSLLAAVFLYSASDSFALYFPYISTSSASIPSFAAISVMGSSLAA